MHPSAFQNARHYPWNGLESLRTEDTYLGGLYLLHRPLGTEPTVGWHPAGSTLPDAPWQQGTDEGSSSVPPFPLSLLAVDVLGDAGDPRVVLLHGWPLDRGIWSDVADRVATAGFRVLCPDLPGFGQSPLDPPDRWTVEAYADAVASFLQASAPGRAAVAGHSFGGYVVLALAERHGSLLAGLGLISSRALADSDAARRGRLETIGKVRAQGAQVLLPDLPAKLVAPGASEDLRARAAHVIEACPAEAIIAGLAAMAARPDRTSVLESWRRPLLVLHGEADQLIPVAEAARPTRPTGTSERVILPGIGHMPMWEAPRKTADALRVWARSAHGL